MTRLPLIVFVLGMALFGAGLYMAWPPLGLIGPGVVLIAVGVFGALDDAQRSRQ